MNAEYRKHVTQKVSTIDVTIFCLLSVYYFYCFTVHFCSLSFPPTYALIYY